MQPKMDFAKISDSTMPPRCYTGFPGHPECDGYMSQELQGNHTQNRHQTAQRPHTCSSAGPLLEGGMRLACMAPPWPIEVPGRARWMGGRVGVGGHHSGGVPDCRLVPYRAVFLCFLGCRPSVVVCCVLSDECPTSVHRVTYHSRRPGCPLGCVLPLGLLPHGARLWFTGGSSSMPYIAVCSR